MAHYEKETEFEASCEELFAWHARPGAFERLAPPWMCLRVERSTGIKDGDRAVFTVRKGPFRVRWEAVHCDWVEGREFSDVQAKGPFALWKHTHQFEPRGSKAVLRDIVDYQLPLHALSGGLFEARVQSDLERLFRFRHERLRRDIHRHRSYGPGRCLRIAISGASGMIGSALAAFLSTGGHEVVRLVRRPPHTGAKEIFWNPGGGVLEAASLEGFNVMVHLSGRSIASGRWSGREKDRLRRSRTESTRLLSETMAALQDPPEVLLCASAIGYYDHASAGPWTEASGKGSGFLAELVEAWEAAAKPARDAGIRVVNLRLGPVLSPTGGALGKMLAPFRLGLGGIVGSGRQYLSWIGLDDVIGILLFLISRPSITGPVNATAPHPVTNLEFTKTLGGVLHRPTYCRVPASLIRLLLGEMGQATLLDGARVTPAKLIQAGFEFQDRLLEGSLRWELGLPAEKE